MPQSSFAFRATPLFGNESVHLAISCGGGRKPIYCRALVLLAAKPLTAAGAVLSARQYSSHVGRRGGIGVLFLPLLEIFRFRRRPDRSAIRGKLAAMGGDASQMHFLLLLLSRSDDPGRSHRTDAA